MKLYRYVFVLLLAVSVPAGALDLTTLDIHSGILWLIDEPADDETTGAPDPLLTPVGVGTSFPLRDTVSFDPMILIYGLNYAYQNWDRPRPAQIEQREMYVISLVLSPEFVFTFDWNERMDWGLLLSPTMILRIPTLAAPGEDSAQGEMLSYFIGPGRFLFPEAGMFLDVKINDRLSFRPALKLYMPVFHLWDGDPLIDQTVIGLDIGLRFALKANKP